MDEFRFVLKCFGFAALFLVITQIKAGNMTIEGHIESSLVNSKVSGFVNQVAAGGVKLLREAYNYSLESYREWKRSDDSTIANSADKVVVTVAKPAGAPELSTVEDAEELE